MILICVCYSLRPVPAVYVPAGLSVPAEGAGRAARHGHHHRGVPLVDVEGPVVPAALSLRRLRVRVLQRLYAV